jgi:hypothetical protein
MLAVSTLFLLTEEKIRECVLLFRTLTQQGF